MNRDAMAFLETQEFDGVEITSTPVRYYPYGELGAHSIGYMREVDAEALDRLDERGYRSGDRIGAVGIERRWESYLRGERGWRKIVRGNRRNLEGSGIARRENTAEVEAKYLEEPRRLEPIPGRDISLTLDVDLIASMDKTMRVTSP